MKKALISGGGAKKIELAQSTHSPEVQTEWNGTTWVQNNQWRTKLASKLGGRLVSPKTKKKLWGKSDLTGIRISKTLQENLEGS